MAKPEAKSQTNEPMKIGFFLIPNFPMLAFSAALEPLRVANWVVGRALYSWHIFSIDGLPVQSSSGVPIPAEQSIDSVDHFPLMLVCAGIDGHVYNNKQAFAWMRRLARGGTILGGIGTAAFALARAGLLDGHRCTIHWEEAERLSQKFSAIEVADSLFEIDGNRMTCAGAVASLNMMLSLIERHHGKRLAGDIADELLQHDVRSGDQPQRVALSLRTRTSDPRLLAAVEAMEDNLEDPLPFSGICGRSGLSPRHLQRRFSETFGCTLTDFYRELRLRHARKLLMHDSKSILDVAIATGFKSGSHFTRRYRARYGRVPKDERRLSRSKNR
jgi:AraC family transcriptional regulator, glycine betaine-responsive activator